jgi:hypothetical protein
VYGGRLGGKNYTGCFTRSCLQGKGKKQEGSKIMSQGKPTRVHVIVGGFPPGSAAGHDMDYARIRLLELLQSIPQATATTVANDFTDVAKWLPTSRFLITYVAGPFRTRSKTSSFAGGSKQAGDGSRYTAPAAVEPSALPSRIGAARWSKGPITRLSAASS